MPLDDKSSELGVIIFVAVLLIDTCILVVFSYLECGNKGNSTQGHISIRRGLKNINKIKQAFLELGSVRPCDTVMSFR